MSESVELRKVEVGGSFSAKFEKSLGGISRVTMTAQCGEPARVDLELGGPNTQNKDVTNITGGDQLQKVLDANKKIQQATFDAEESKVTVKLEVTNLIPKGGSEEVTFTGVLASPGFSIAPGQFAASCTLVHEDVLMESVDPSIYLRQGNVMGTTTDVLQTKLVLKFETEFLKSVRRQPLNKHIELLIQSSIKNDAMAWNNRDPNRQEANAKNNLQNADDVCNAIHAHNKEAGPLNLIQGLLDRSTDTELLSDSGDLSGSVPLFGGQEVFQSAANPESYGVWLCTTYGSSRNFYNFLMQVVVPNFLMEYTCQIDGFSKIGHPQVDTKTAGGPIPVQISSFSFNLGSRYQRALGMVVCNGGSYFLTGANEVGNSNTDMGAYPEDVNPENGKIIHTEGPPWFTPSGRRTKPENTPDKDDVQDPNARIPDGMGKEDSKKAKDACEDAVPQGNEKASDFLSLWAERQYRLWCLKNTTATITMPLDLKWGQEAKNPIGKRYAIKPKDGAAQNSGILFSGYLNRVQHSAAVGESVGNATTILDFTHIKCHDVTLGGLNT